jgi:pilus assembly protein CpaF
MKLDKTNPFGPLAPLMAEAAVSEIMVDGPARVYVKRGGRFEDTDIRFDSIKQLLTVIGQLLALAGRQLNQESPLLACRLPDGTEIHAVLPPIAAYGPALTLRKYYREFMGVDTLVRLGVVSAEVGLFLRACVRAKLNIMISSESTLASTGLFDALLSYIPYEERLIVIEKETRLHLRRNRVVRLVTPPPNRAGQSPLTMRDLLRHSLSLSPDRLIVGELAGAEAFDLIQALRNGHKGVMTLLRAGQPREALIRLEQMALLDNLSTPLLALRQVLAATLDLIVQQTRLQDGLQRVTAVAEVQGLAEELPALTELFVFETQGLENGRVVGRLKPTGNIPTFVERLKATGVTLPPNLFGLAPELE